MYIWNECYDPSLFTVSHYRLMQYVGMAIDYYTHAKRGLS